ncbi:MAG: hypothetical protein L6Q99_12445 [Planctomycetes bacterium]|nr:hypothetical protein [Planctomycetota bacterium]
MLRLPLRTSLALGALSSLAAAQSPTFTSGPDFYGWPDATPSGLTKFVAANTTLDDSDDAFALHGTALYFVHGAGTYPRWQPVADGVTDFIVTRRGNSDVAVFATSAGLKAASWTSDAMQIGGISGSPILGDTPLLAASRTANGGTTIAGVTAAGTVVCGRWDDSGAWTTTTTIEPGAVPTGLAAAEFSNNAGAEIAMIVSGALQICAENGAPVTVTGLPAEVGHKVFALPGGAEGGVMDSFVYVTASPVSGSVEAFWEVFPNGVSLPFPTGNWTIRNIVGSKPWSNGRRGVMVHTANTGEVFRLEKWFDVPGVNTILGPTTTHAQEAFWWIPVTAVEAAGAPVLDGLMACGDFDSDGLDDILVASTGNRFSYLFPAQDDENRENGITQIDWAGSMPIGGEDSGTTVLFGISLTLSSIPEGFSASQPPNALLGINWVREGGVGTYLNTTPSPRVIHGCAVGQPTTLWLQATTNIAPEESLVYVSVRPARVDFGTNPPTILQQGTAVNMMTVLGGTTTANPLLCGVFSGEPDRYTAENRVELTCPGSAGVGEDDGVIIGGFSRRSTIGPFPPGYGSPPGQ